MTAELGKAITKEEIIELQREHMALYDRLALQLTRAEAEARKWKLAHRTLRREWRALRRRVAVLEQMDLGYGDVDNTEPTGDWIPLFKESE